jgi:hypothetical protein
MTDKKAKPYEVNDTLKKYLRCSYKDQKIFGKDLNKDVFKMQRYCCAKYMLKLLQNNKRLISFDESWLVNLNFQRKGWSKINTTYTIDPVKLSRRVTMIGAIDS